MQPNDFATRYADGGGGAPGARARRAHAARQSPAPPRSVRAASRFGRSDPHADDINADPGAPRWNLAPHRTGCRQMVLTGGQRDRAALLEARTRPLGGLAALSAILSEPRNAEKMAKDQTMSSYDDLPVKVAQPRANQGAVHDAERERRDRRGFRRQSDRATRQVGISINHAAVGAGHPNRL
jgi:hypothetical protein